MNIENLIKELSKILPTEGRSSMAGLYQKIRAILRGQPTDPEPTTNKQEVRTALLSNPADPEPSIIIVEALLIEAINGTSDTTTKNIYRLALKIVLFSRGHFTDELGIIEKILLTLPHDNPACNPDNKNPNYPANDPRLWAFINKIRLKISNCLDQQATLTTTMEDKFLDLLQLLTALKEKYERLGVDPLDECLAADLGNATKFHRFKIDYLKKCLSTLRDNRVFRSSIEHSIWASSIVQTVDDLRHVKSDVFKRDLPVSHDKKNEVIAGIVDMHSMRLTYFSHRSKLLCEPLGYHAENQLLALSGQPVLSARRKKSPTQISDFEQLKSQASSEMAKKRQVDIANIRMVHALILDYQKSKEGLFKAYDLATQLVANKQPLGRFLEICALTLISPPTTKERWHQHFQTLLDIPISACWRPQIGELWFCLSEFFGNADPNLSFYREVSIQCARQITDRFGKKLDLMSKLRVATLLNVTEEIASIQRELSAVELDSINSPLNAPESVMYPKLPQYFLCKFQSRGSAQQSAAADLSPVDQYCELIRDNYPFGLECVIRWLQEPTLAEYSTIVSAVTLQYGKKSKNPLHLCQTAFRGTASNRYLMIWGPIYAAALKNKYLSETIDAWLEQGLKDHEILVKLLSEIRLQLDIALYNSPVLVPGAYHYLTRLDSELYDMQIKFLESLETDPNAKEFAFCRNRPGLIYAIWAEEAFRAGNLYLANLFANKSLLPATAAKSKKDSLSTEKTQGDNNQNSPRKAVSSVEISVPVNQGEDAPERPRRFGPKRLFSDSNKRGSETPKASSAPSDLNASHSSKDLHSLLPDKESSPTKKGSVTPRSNTPVAPLDFTNMSPAINTTPPQSPPGKSNVEHPTTLGYLIKAMILWNTSIKNKKNRSVSDLTIFADHLKSARETAVLVEQYYIKGIVWWCYFDSNFDDIWITTDEDKALFQATLDAISEPRKKKLFFDEKRIKEYTAIKLSRSYFNRALKRDERDDNSQFEMYPLAAVAFEKLLWMQVAEFDHGTPLLDESMLELASLLKECVDVHGHILAGYSYACILNKHTDLFRRKDSFADMLRTMKRYFDLSERFVMIDPKQKADFERDLKEYKRKEAVVRSFGEAINIIDYSKREAILSQINAEFDHPEDSTLCERLLTNVRESWCSEELRQWFSIKSGCAISLTTLQRRFELIIKREFAQGDKKTFQKRLLTKIGSELCSMRESLFSAVENWKPDPSIQDADQDTISPFVRNVNNLTDVANLSWVNPLFSSSVSTFFKHRLLSASEEIPTLTKCVLEKLPITLTFQSSRFTFAHPSCNTDDQSFCLQITSLDDEPDILQILQKRFECALKVYCYSKKVSFTQTNPIRTIENRIEITHLDIAVLGIIKFIQGKYPGGKCRDSQITELVELLRKAQSLDQQIWQWEGTLPLLSAFLKAHNSQLSVKKAVLRVHSSSISSPGPSRHPNRFSHLALDSDGSQTHAVSSRNPSRRGSGIFAGPDVSPPPVKAILPSSSLPTSPRGDEQSPASQTRKNGSKTGSIKFKPGSAQLLEVSSEAIPPARRSRSATTNNPPRPDSSEMKFK